MRKRVMRSLIAVLAVVLLSAVTVLAYLSAVAGPVENELATAPQTDPTIEETFEEGIKTDVAVNVGDPGYAVYVRAVILINWEKDGTDGIYHATTPVAGRDYVLTLNQLDWFEHEDFYYLCAMVNKGRTEELIQTCKLVDDAQVPEGYHLSVEIIAQTVQALGATDADNKPAVTDAWGIRVDQNGKLIDPSI